MRTPRDVISDYEVRVVGQGDWPNTTTWLTEKDADAIIELLDKAGYVIVPKSSVPPAASHR
jgi:hypothetical protein